MWVACVLALVGVVTIARANSAAAAAAAVSSIGGVNFGDLLCLAGLFCLYSRSLLPL